MHAFSKAVMSCERHCEDIRPKLIEEVEKGETEESRVVLGQKRVYAPVLGSTKTICERIFRTGDGVSVVSGERQRTLCTPVLFGVTMRFP